MRGMPPFLLAVLLAAATGHGLANFVAHGPAGMKIQGQSQELTASSDDERVVVSVPLKSLATGIELRDRHMREDLQVDKFPLVALSVRKSLIKVPAAGGEVSGEAPGELTLHGQTRPVTIRYRAVQKDGTDVSGSVRINLKEFGVEVRTYLGISVKPDVDVDVAFHLAG